MRFHVIGGFGASGSGAPRTARMAAGGVRGPAAPAGETAAIRNATTRTAAANTGAGRRSFVMRADDPTRTEARPRFAGAGLRCPTDLRPPYGLATGHWLPAFGPPPWTQVMRPWIVGEIGCVWFCRYSATSWSMMFCVVVVLFTLGYPSPPFIMKSFWTTRYSGDPAVRSTGVAEHDPSALATTADVTRLPTFCVMS